MQDMRLRSTGATGGAVDLGAVHLGKPVRNGSCQWVGILPEGPNRRKFMAARAGPYQRTGLPFFPLSLASSTAQ